MTSGLNMAEIAALIGDPGRANMLCALMNGRALTATELASVAGGCFHGLHLAASALADEYRAGGVTCAKAADQPEVARRQVLGVFVKGND